ncbi:uberolysin/carnocyclin family circular bacteriocin [Weizmannia coagulans]|jgi:circularin A/uberolysin family circular bacteriocin|uniref:Circular bacteriocin, circularin A/uberolysin family n=2 Tax=Heyndrickxia TaxID=2837504 RepID=A0A133KCP3_HEYCO|nr:MULTISPECIES: uberolysin/carnocyclin family circular bacteriocin [Heyndrickxia]NWN94544.1 circular bacteriocin, circularin A/uberolysin family [Bacillus sp. (in: firmicutes)]APB37679.1 bacteriocin AS-48 [Heyndrickxia coagulans]ATW81645.1 circular bacteriocin, circularin A/uberolysin family [Heyndrickxia coagulans]AVD57668.1 circular bacteriocin, circularin A/uberolysin family [Heyndrickxia coagulans]AWP38618.1 circular bacteriocin, circularin A/uberolysin family [Heyndrickxia coagulans]
MGLFHVASKFHVSAGIASGVVTAVLHAGTIASIIGAVTVVMSGGVDAILDMGWTAFIAEVKHLAKEYGKKRAIAW